MSETLIVQSYRTHNVAPWIAACMESVQRWAAEKGYAYEFVNDRLFDAVPSWFRERCGKQLLPVTDLARLLLIQERLDQGWKQVVWVDADVLVFDSQSFRIDVQSDYVFCRELWVYRDANGRAQSRFGVNNAVIMMRSGASMAPFLIDATKAIIKNTPQDKIDHIIVGTRLLSRLAQVMPIEQLTNVGLFSPPLIMELTQGGAELSRLFAARFVQPIAAVNLCASLTNTMISGVTVREDDMSRMVELMLSSKGAVIN